MIALKGAIQDFTISSLCRKPSPTCRLKWSGHSRVQITCNTSSAYVQHVCHVVQRDSSAIMFDRVEISFTLAFYFTGWNHKPMKEARKPLMTSFRKCHMLKPENSSPDGDSNPLARKADVLTMTPRVAVAVSGLFHVPAPCSGYIRDGSA